MEYLSDKAVEFTNQWNELAAKAPYKSKDGEWVAIVTNGMQERWNRRITVFDNAGPVSHHECHESQVEKTLAQLGFVPRSYGIVRITAGSDMNPSVNYGGFGFRPTGVKNRTKWIGPAEHREWFMSRLASGGYVSQWEELPIVTKWKN